MTDKTDAQIARQWVEAWLEEPTNGLLAAVYRHILATTQSPTMADVQWDDEVHAGLCAEHAGGEVVLMVNATISTDWIRYILPNGEISGGPSKLLTPIPGTKIDLTPRREPGPEPEPESTPDHPELLETKEDYETAPEGTIVAQDEDKPFVLRVETWRFGGSWVLGPSEMAGIRRRVLRWGWEE